MTATDRSHEMIAHARVRSDNHADAVIYKVLDAADPDQIMALGKETFETAISNMTVMDMAVITPMFKAVYQVLKPGECFVFSQTHPCFQAPYAVKYAEQADLYGEIIKKYGIKIDQYLTPTPFEGLGIVGQPVAQYYFHRPISTLLSACVQAGFVLDGMEERAFDDEAEGRHPFSWRNFKERPPVLAVRLRRVA